jgi:hypothetical protein
VSQAELASASAWIEYDGHQSGTDVGPIIAAETHGRESKERTVSGLSDLNTPITPHLAVTPPAIAQRRSADWGVVQPEQVEVIRHETFDYEFKGSQHVLIATERAERHDGETILDG